MVDIIHRVGIKAPISKVYSAIATTEGVASWWTTSTSGEAKVGSIIKVVFLSPAGEEKGSMDMEVKALDKDKKVQWRFKAGPEEWIGTDAVFNLTQEGEYTIVNFAHQNWKEAVEFTGHCSLKWGVFLMSLKELIETGKGKPSPNDTKIDNWN
ncbi:MAG: SRPBCC domain-containing protein [Bdellovibrionota bacterium]